MKKNLPITQIKHPFPHEMRIISKTNLKNSLTYINDTFVRSTTSRARN